MSIVTQQDNKNIALIAYNPYLDITKFIMANSVICIHNCPPGEIGYTFDCLARVAVPFFFIIAGYYSYNCKNRVLWKRLFRIINLFVGIYALSLLYGGIKTICISNGNIYEYLHSIISRVAVTNFLIYGLTPFPFSNQLWFLVALVIAYLYLIIMNSFVRNDRTREISLTVIMTVLLIGHFVVGTIIPIVTGITTVNYYYRNAWLFGIPIFVLGLALHMFENPRNCSVKRNEIIRLAIILIGMILGLLQWFRFGRIEMPVGILLATVSLFLFIVDLPKIIVKYEYSDRLISVSKCLGRSSLWIYALHRLIGDAITTYAPYNDLVSFINANGYLLLLAVMVISNCISVIIVFSQYLIKSKRKAKRISDV